MLNVAYFSNHFSRQRIYGITRYTLELFEALRSTQPLLNVQAVSAWRHSGSTDTISNGVRKLPWGRYATPITWSLINSPNLEHWLQGTVDVVHSPAMEYPVATNKPYAATFHDIGPLTHPEFFRVKGAWTFRYAMKRLARKADALICVSQSTADQLDMYFGNQVSDRIHIVHEGISPAFLEPPAVACSEILDQIGVGEKPYLLSVGGITPRKNTRRIIQALDRLSDVIPHHLVLAGGEGWSTQEVHREIDRSSVSSRIHLAGYVSDEQLKSLYATASAYLHPSLYEGFGLTVLEAMAQNCPVITSRVHSLPEIAGDAALLVDPRSVAEISDAIEAVCTQAALAEDLRARGRQRTGLFSWEASAAGVADVYRGLA